MISQNFQKQQRTKGYANIKRSTSNCEGGGKDKVRTKITANRFALVLLHSS